MNEKEYEKLDHVHSILCRVRKRFYDDECTQNEAHFELGRLYSYVYEWIESVERPEEIELDDELPL